MISFDFTFFRPEEVKRKTAFKRNFYRLELHAENQENSHWALEAEAYDYFTN